MSWICRNCETENPDSMDVCEVCETHAPRIVAFSYDKVLSGKPIVVKWKTEFCDNVSIYYKGETIDVTEEDSYSIENPEEQEICFLLSNSDTTTRTVCLTMDFIERPNIEFNSSKLKLINGKKESAVLTWNVDNSSRAVLIIDEERIDISLAGELEVFPEVTTRYKIEALSLDDETIFTEELYIGVFDECTIDFVADKYYVYPKIPVVLSWKVTNAKSIKLDAEPVESVGTKLVEPEKATVYVLRVEDEFGIKEKRISIEMLPIPQVKSIMAPMPNFVSNTVITIQQPKYNVEARFPKIDIGWITVEVPKVKSLTEAELFQELSPPLHEVKFNLMSSIKQVFNHILEK